MSQLVLVTGIQCTEILGLASGACRSAAEVWPTHKKKEQIFP